jgi:hypothetical protein
VKDCPKSHVSRAQKDATPSALPPRAPIPTQPIVPFGASGTPCKVLNLLYKFRSSCFVADRTPRLISLSVWSALQAARMCVCTPMESGWAELCDAGSDTLSVWHGMHSTYVFSFLIQMWYVYLKLTLVTLCYF